MSYRYYHPIEVRYGDIDAQGHVNNARYLTYLEQARINYLRHLALWDTKSFMEIGVILADVHLTFRSAITLGQPVRVGVKTTHIGNKSMRMSQCIEDAETGQLMAEALTIMVAYDYRSQKTILVPETWRKMIAAFEQELN